MIYYKYFYNLRFMERVALIIDQIGDGENVFEQFASEFEYSYMQGINDEKLKIIQIKIELIERSLQDLSEFITVENENYENVYSFTISKTKAILSVWLPAFSRRNIHPKISDFIVSELDKLLSYLSITNIDKKTIEQIEFDFETQFNIGLNDIRVLRQQFIPNHLHTLSIPQIEDISYGVVTRVVNIVITKEFLGSTTHSCSSLNPTDGEVFENEDTIYIGELKLWIDTNDAAKANLFMSIVTNTLAGIENVKVSILDSGTGSLWQKCKLTITGWFAKEETKQILQKSQKALEAYSLDRHIEPVEKSKVDRQRQEEEIKRMMPVGKVNQLQDIQIEKEKAQLEMLKLNNLEKKIEITSKLSQALANGLYSIDSDYRIEIDNILLISQEAGVITFSTASNLDNILKAEESSTENEIKDE